MTYGRDVHSFVERAEQHTPLATFGVAVPEYETAVLGVATVGAAETSVEAIMAPHPMSFSRGHIRFVYRRVVTYPMRQKGVFTRSYERDRISGDRTVRYFFLAGEDANWVGMAQRLRRHLLEDRRIPRLSDSAANATLRLRLLMGAEKPGLLWRQFVKATTFEQATEIVSSFSDAGMSGLDLVLVGWGAGGYEGKLPRRWPPDRRLGGTEGLRHLAVMVHGLGGRLILEDDYTLAFLANGGFIPPIDVVTEASLLPVTDMVSTDMVSTIPAELKRNRFLLNPLFATERYLQRDVPRLAALGVDGLELRWAGELVLKDANRAHPLERTEFAQAWHRMLTTVRDTMGSAAAQGGNAYVLGAADTVTQFPLEHSDWTFGEETVPFYPIATHGLVRIYGKPSNLSSQPERDALRRIEYGMLPAFELTYRSSIVLARTTYSELYSSLYVDWLDRAAAEYAALVGELGHTVGQFIVGHRQLAPQVFETRYEDGTRVIVNYGRQAYEADDMVVDGSGYLIVR